MKKIFQIIFVALIVGCTPVRREYKSKKAVYIQASQDINRWILEYRRGEITLEDLNVLLLGEHDYLTYFVKPIKKRYN